MDVADGALSVPADIVSLLIAVRLASFRGAATAREFAAGLLDRTSIVSSEENSGCRDESRNN